MSQAVRRLKCRKRKAFMKIFNRKLKITSSALLTLCMVFVMTACAENSSQSEKSQPAEQTTVQPTTMSAEEINDRKLDKFISDMTLEEKVGQMFFVRCPDEDAVQQVSEYNIGGYILFGRDFDGKTKDEVVDDIHSYQNEADIPLLIGVDEEGGTVVRVSSNPNLRETPFLSPKILMQTAVGMLSSRMQKKKRICFFHSESM